jgi:hypothetical protein
MPQPPTICTALRHASSHQALCQGTTAAGPTAAGGGPGACLLKVQQPVAVGINAGEHLPNAFRGGDGAHSLAYRAGNRCHDRRSGVEGWGRGGGLEKGAAPAGGGCGRAVPIGRCVPSRVGAGALCKPGRRAGAAAGLPCPVAWIGARRQAQIEGRARLGVGVCCAEGIRVGEQPRLAVVWAATAAGTAAAARAKTGAGEVGQSDAVRAASGSGGNGGGDRRWDTCPRKQLDSPHQSPWTGVQSPQT